MVHWRVSLIGTSKDLNSNDSIEMRNRSSLIVIDVIKESQLEKFVLLYFFLDNKITFIKKKFGSPLQKKLTVE